jgi:hypothetical protein
MRRTLILRVSFASITALISGCSLYSNTDRDNFNSRATVQPTSAVAVASCELQTETATNATASAIVVTCGTPPNAKTIVRVSR